MSRLFIFLFGVLVGAAGVAYFYSTYRPIAREQTTSTPIVETAQVEPPPPPALPSPAEMSQPLPGDALDRSTMADAVTPPPVATSPVESATIEPTMPSDAAAPPPAPATLVNGSLLIPVTGVKTSQLVDTYTQARGAGRTHDAIDIMAARGTPVLAADDGQVVKLFTSKPGGLTVYQFDRERKVAYYYAHLDRYAPGLVEGAQLKRGDPVGFVGSTGNASPEAPHLHFAVFILGPEKVWWKGTAINPFPLLGGKTAGPVRQAPR